MTKKKSKIEVRIGSRFYTYDKGMKKCIKKEMVTRVTSRTFMLKDLETQEERKVYRYYN